MISGSLWNYSRVKINEDEIENDDNSNKINLQVNLLSIRQ